MKKNNTTIEIDRLLNKPVSPWQRFHHATKFKRFSKDGLDPESWPKEWKKIYYKAYGRLKEICLPSPALSSNTSLIGVLNSRKSCRKFSKKSLSLKNLGSLLFFSAGLRREREPYRFYPSAGARYPLETYIIAMNINRLNSGLYHYYTPNHSLEKLISFKKFVNNYFNQEWVNDASALILITSLFERTTSKYGDRGYRHILAETGHLGQNFYLVASALRIGCCAIGGYLDDRLNQLLDIDGITESVVYVLAVGTT